MVSGDDDGAADVTGSRPKREIYGNQLDALTTTVMAALDAGQCQQRITCELASYFNKSERDNILTQ